MSSLWAPTLRLFDHAIPGRGVVVSTSVQACSLQPRGSPDRGGCSVIVRALLTFAGSEIEPKRQDANARRPEERAFRTLPRRRGLRRLAICHSC